MEKHKPRHEAAYYLENIINTAELPKAVDRAAKKLKKVEFDTIAFRGISGALTAIPLALKMKKTLLAVRKPEDLDNHSSHRVEGDIGARKYIVVDDIVGSGRTKREIQEEITKVAPNAEYVGVYEFTGNNFRRKHAYKNRAD